MKFLPGHSEYAEVDTECGEEGDANRNKDHEQSVLKLKKNILLF